VTSCLPCSQNTQFELQEVPKNSTAIQKGKYSCVFMALQNLNIHKLIPCIMKPRQILFWLLIMAVLFIFSQSNYLLYHTVVEQISIVIAAGIFIVAWNTRKYVRNDYFMFIGIAYLFIAILDTLHTLSFEGMLLIGDANVSTQYWLAARYLEAASLLFAPLFIKHRLKIEWVWAAFIAVFSGLIASINYGYFPVAYDNSLTVFKIASEFIIIAMLFVAVLYIRTVRKQISGRIYRLLVASIVLTMLAELSFTLYVDTYGLFNMVGHYFKLFSFVLIYYAVIVTNLNRPYAAMFRGLKAKEQKLKEANETKIEFMNMAVHELRNPLTSLVGYSKMLLARGNLGESEKEQVKIIGDESWRMKRLVDDLLDIVKLEGRKMKFDMNEINMNKLLDDSFKEMKPYAGKIKFSRKVQANLPHVRADHGRIIQVIRNIVGNAFKFTEKGSVRLTAEEKEGGVQVEVKDTGIGIAEEDLCRLFVKFSQLDTKHRSKGTGLGLAISKEIVNAHGGKIWGRPWDKGCVFGFWLPGK